MNNTKKFVEKIDARKLVLSRETLRTLASGDLSGIRGGFFYGTQLCATLECTIVTTGGSYDADCLPP
jgi:DNA-binding Xre family transcriptional regulator